MLIQQISWWSQRLLYYQTNQVHVMYHHRSVSNLNKIKNQMDQALLALLYACVVDRLIIIKNKLILCASQCVNFYVVWVATTIR